MKPPRYHQSSIQPVGNCGLGFSLIARETLSLKCRYRPSHAVMLARAHRCWALLPHPRCKDQNGKSRSGSKDALFYSCIHSVVRHTPSNYTVLRSSSLVQKSVQRSERPQIHLHWSMQGGQVTTEGRSRAVNSMHILKYCSTEDDTKTLE